jgi:hypothetical protein
MRKVLAAYESVVAMSFNRKKALERLSALQLQIARHLFLLSQYPDEAAVRHWLTELRAWNDDLRTVHRGKKGQLNYTVRLLRKALWEEPLGEEGDRREVAAQLSRKGLPLIKNPDVPKLKSFVDKFIEDVLNPTPGHTFTPPEATPP